MMIHHVTFQWTACHADSNIQGAVFFIQGVLSMPESSYAYRDCEVTLRTVYDTFICGLHPGLRPSNSHPIQKLRWKISTQSVTDILSLRTYVFWNVIRLWFKKNDHIPRPNLSRNLPQSLRRPSSLQKNIFISTPLLLNIFTETSIWGYFLTIHVWSKEKDLMSHLQASF